MRCLLSYMLLVAVIPAATSEPSIDAALLGEWVLTRAILHGEETEIGAQISREFNEKEIVLRVNGRELSRRRYSVLPNKEPKEMEYAYRALEGEIRTAKAIYKIEGETLTICASLQSNTPPSQFDSSIGSDRTLDVYERAVNSASKATVAIPKEAGSAN